MENSKNYSLGWKGRKNVGEHVTKIPDWQGVLHPQSYPRNLVPGGPSCRIRLTRLSPSFRGGGAVGRWSLLIHTQQRGGVKKKLWTHHTFVYTHTSKYTCTQTHTYPRNCAPVGPTSMMRPASPSPSTIGGIEAKRCLFTSLHVTRVGAEHFLGGTMIRRPLWRQPRMAPPLASTMKLTRKLKIEWLSKTQILDCQPPCKRSQPKQGRNYFEEISRQWSINKQFSATNISLQPVQIHST